MPSVTKVLPDWQSLYNSTNDTDSTCDVDTVPDLSFQVQPYSSVLLPGL